MKTKRFRATILFILALVFCGASSQAATAGRKFVVQARGFSQTYLCAKDVDTGTKSGGGIEGGVIHANLKRGGDTYLLISWTHFSGGNPNGMCGAGEESSIYWLHVHGNTLLEFKGVKYASCWTDIDGEILGWTGPIFAISYERSDCKGGGDCVTIHSKATFDSKAPEKGIRVDDEPPEKMQ